MNSHKTYTVDEAKRRMERYCAYQERCHKEVKDKLKEMRMIPDAIDLIILHLLQHNFLNETRYAQAYARGKFNIKKWGKNRIIRELKLRQISKYNLEMALKEIPSEVYYATFHELAEKRLTQLEYETNLQKKKKKFADYMFYRGWEPSLVYERMGTILK